MVNTRPRISAYHTRRKRINNNTENAFAIKTVRQFFVSVIILASVFAVSKINISICNKFIENTKAALCYTIDYKSVAENIIQKAKKLPDLFSKNTMQQQDTGDDQPINTEENISNDIN
ncbi:MAG: hypothetical protein GX800_02125 [Clostridiaceae bacterium]|jgi:hypothetical protein|nr:hypothetical protein [Clostridiaceae bacterium]